MPPSRRKIEKSKKNKKQGKTPVRRPKLATSKSARRQAVGTLGTNRNRGRKSIGRLFEDLVAVQVRLRAPGGCPWDREQTHHTLKTYLIEEAYEVLDALENNDPRELTEELGDLFFQVLFHADIAREAGAFDISDVIAGIHNKMVRRHPHVFGDVKAETSSDVLKNWAQIKAAEKQTGSSNTLTSLVPSVLEGIPRSLPALLEAYQLTRRAAQVGFDWERVEGIFEKLREETLEIQVALDASDKRSTEEEVGDLLFVVVNLARFLGFDPEVALKHSSLKFKSRFQDMETEASKSGQRLALLSKEELEILWNVAKTHAKEAASVGGKK